MAASLSKLLDVKILNPTRFTSFRVQVLLATALFLNERATQAAQPGGLPALAERVAALEELVSAQSNQIAVLIRVLDAEMSARIDGQSSVLETAIHYTDRQLSAEATVRQAADGDLQRQISNIPPPPFSTGDISTLQRLLKVTSVTGTNVQVAGNVCVAGDLAVIEGHTLLCNGIQPIDTNCLSDPAGMTIFNGNVGIAATNALRLSRIEPIDSGLFPPNVCGLTFGNGLINGRLPSGGGCTGNAVPTIFFGPVFFEK